jgi:hypothetical protein
MIKAYFNCLIDTESHPQITTKKSAIEIATNMTTNHISVALWEADEDYKYLMFREVMVIDDSLPDFDLEGAINALRPQCPDAEFSSYRRFK